MRNAPVGLCNAIEMQFAGAGGRPVAKNADRVIIGCGSFLRAGAAAQRALPEENFEM